MENAENMEGLQTSAEQIAEEGLGVATEQAEGITETGLPPEQEPTPEPIDIASTPEWKAYEEKRFASWKKKLDEKDARIREIERERQQSLEERQIRQVAEERGLDPDELLAEVKRQNELIEKKAKELAANDPSVLQSRQLVGELRAQKDLEEIKAAFPEIKAGSLDELIKYDEVVGLEFAQLMRDCKGRIPAAKAYAMAKANKGFGVPEQPISTGSTEGAVETDSDYFTPEEMSQFNPADLLKDEKLLEKFERSEKYWAKKK